jgi:hypothetical protein
VRQGMTGFISEDDLTTFEACLTQVFSLGRRLEKHSLASCCRSQVAPCSADAVPLARCRAPRRFSSGR